jgi:hypothetical protein
LTLAVVWAGSRLIMVLNRHLFQFRVTGERYSSIKGGILKVLFFFFFGLCVKVTQNQLILRTSI